MVMYTKKLTDDEFLEMIIDKELEIAQADIRYKDIMAMPEKERREFRFYDKYSFKTLEQFIEWQNFFFDHFYDWKPKRVKERRKKDYFNYLNLDLGLRYDFPLEELYDYYKKIKYYG